jgi:hypothetical protein
MRTIRRISPNPPVGAYPQFRLWGHRGSAPRRAKIKITINIVPSMVCSGLWIHQRYRFMKGAASPEAAPGRKYYIEMLIAIPMVGIKKGHETEDGQS